MTRLESPGAHHSQLLSGYKMGVERNGARVPIMSKHQVTAAVAAKLEAFGNDLGNSHAFQDNIHTEAAGQLHYPRVSFFGGTLADVDASVSAKSACDLQAMLRSAQYGNVSCTARFSNSERGKPNRSRALD